MPTPTIVPPIIPHHNDSNGWWETLPAAAPAQTLSGKLRVQTAVIGGGICGVSVANRLAELRPDDAICLLEAERVGNGASGRNAGFMLNLHSHGNPKNLDILRRNINIWEAGLASLRQKVKAHNIQCDWSEAGRFYGAAGADGEKKLQNIALTLEALEQSYARLDQDDLHQRIGTRFYHNGLHTSGSALVNPAALVRGLAQHLPGNVALYEETPVNTFESKGDGFILTTPQGEVTADRVVLAAGVFLKQFGIASGNFIPMATYGSLTSPLDDVTLASMGGGEEFGLLGASEIGATLRLTQDKRLLVRNHFHFAPGAPAPAKRVAEIAQMHRRAMTARWPELADLPFEHSWGGIMAFTRNNGAVFGSMAPNLYAILTNDVSPMTRGEATGALLAEYMEGMDSELLSIQLSIPGASRVPPRPFLDLGIKFHDRYLNFVAGNEF